ncbi:MAG TPA: cupredoxin domain-containing protein, partial [Sporichthya sp.]|nr:cupredoxin domain-containing protein [Sporichthya sp.]
GTTAPRAQPLVTPKPQSTSARPARTPVPRATPADTVRITIQNFKFSPPTLTVKLGQTIEVVNLDSADHTLTADDGSFDSGTLKKGQRYTFTPKEAGTYTYVCDIHQYMTGTITVT